MRITGATHPLTKVIADATRANREERRRWAQAAGLILADHRQHGTSDQSLYDVTQTHPLRRVGDVETHGHLLSHPGYVAVTGRDSINTVLSRIIGPERTRAHDLLDAARLAAPMVYALLVMLLDTRDVEWDTDESVTQAGIRIAMDAAYRRLPGPEPTMPSPANVYAVVVHDLGLDAVYEDVSVVATWWLTHRSATLSRLDERGISWGDQPRSAEYAAATTGVTRGTWTAYVSRGESPAPDVTDPARWYPTTVQAWELTRPRPRHQSWTATTRKNV